MGLCASAEASPRGKQGGQGGSPGSQGSQGSGGKPERAQHTVSSEGVTPELRGEMSKPAMQTTPRRAAKASLIPHVKLHRRQTIEGLYDFAGSVKLGEGMTGAVVKAVQKVSGQDVALKKVRKGLVRDVSALLREIALLAQCDHPNIVRIIGSAEDKNSVYMALEICTGGALLDTLMNSKTHHFSEAQVGRIAVMMFRAVEYCHHIGIVHRDLKLDNWLFESPDGELKLIDFGLSKKFYAGDYNHHGMMRMTSFLGTPGFVAPEMQQTHFGERLEYDNLVDIWSLGVIVFALLSGRMPFKRKPSDCVPLEDKENRAYRKSFVKAPWPQLSDQCKDFVERLLDPDPATRPSAKQALEHPWLKKAARSLKEKRQSTHKQGQALVEQESAALERMTQFARTDALQKAAMMLIVHELHQDEIDDLRAIFYELDKDNDGEITWKEMKEGFLDARVSLPEGDVHSLFDSIMSGEKNEGTFSDNDVIPYSYFLAATMDHHVLRNKARLREAFHAYDPDDTGQVDLSKVMDLLDDHKTKKHGSNTEMMKEQLSEGPKDKHHVTFEEFCAALETFADNSNDRFGEKLENASQATGQQHKKLFKSSKSTRRIDEEVEGKSDARDLDRNVTSGVSSDASSVVQVDSNNISKVTGPQTVIPN